MDYSSSAAEVLDLCTRKRSRSPGHATPSRPPVYDSEICQYSPVSNSDSEPMEISSNSDPKMFNLKTKSCRPFKAYIKDPLRLTQGLVNPDALLVQDSSEAFVEFRKKIMSQVQPTNNGTNKNMRRLSNNTQNKISDPTYWEKRRKNNEAAKRSRDARRAKEDEIAIRCAFLEQENFHLKFMSESLKKEIERLHEIIYSRKSQNA